MKVIHEETKSSVFRLVSEIQDSPSKDSMQLTSDQQSHFKEVIKRDVLTYLVKGMQATIPEDDTNK
jgi:hypothetical protein